MQEKRIELNGRTIILKPVPATVGYEIAMRLVPAFGNNDTQALIDAVYEQLQYCELELGDGRKVLMKEKTFIDQHLTIGDVLKLQDEVIQFNFGFLMKGDRSDSLKK